jgi:hypothetical protein
MGVLAGSSVISDGNVAMKDVKADATAANAEDARAFCLWQRP